MNRTDLDRLIDKLSELSEDFDNIDLEEFYFKKYDLKERLSKFISTDLPDLDKKQLKELIAHISSYCKFPLFPNESLLDVLKAEKILENWDKLEI